MGRIVVAGMVSIDGYIEGRRGDLSAMPMSESFNLHNADRIRDATSLLYGATTFRQMLAYWPAVLEEDGHSEAEREIARRMRDGIPITVISDSLTPADVEPWGEQTTIVPRSGAEDAVRRLREDGREGDVVVFGSLTVWPALLAAGLVDELSLMVGAKVVAGDRNVWAGLPETDLRLREVVRYPEDAVVLRYEVAPG
ncbi:dihydrofolate reductase family protein [Homoserinibacter sp. YIM 151385]|uniref:dihydrofolate reductase family protein n=1 Tax=Homoserinibacter sp. YIM 151385 TaxID=2985506 RepID=UPI0022F07590|nr:dihydrofolate reductase family protein [Homoserinibacter sp. YIM 151385]WBU39072.1 dihydrofolate reductase family protein [Homoserinibacter sp. YIM 151385]